MFGASSAPRPENDAPERPFITAQPIQRVGRQVDQSEEGPVEDILVRPASADPEFVLPVTNAIDVDAATLILKLPTKFLAARVRSDFELDLLACCSVKLFVRTGRPHPCRA
jgi:hypothetical protein